MIILVTHPKHQHTPPHYLILEFQAQSHTYTHTHTHTHRPPLKQPNMTWSCGTYTPSPVTRWSAYTQTNSAIQLHPIT